MLATGTNIIRVAAGRRRQHRASCAAPGRQVREASFGLAAGRDTGWRLELGAAPPDPDVFVRLPCALFWPPFGRTDAGAAREPDELAAGLGAWTYHAGATRADFHAERDRIAALVTARLGPPDAVRAGDHDTKRAVWSRGSRSLVVETTDDINSYSSFDLLAVQVRRSGPGLAEPGG